MPASSPPLATETAGGRYTDWLMTWPMAFVAMLCSKVWICDANSLAFTELLLS